jgi:N-acetylglucosamine-6-phosphate deacetylase
LADDRLVGMFITDGHHLPADFVRVALRAKGVKNVVVTSDAAPIAGLPPGEYKFAGSEVVSKPDGRIELKNGLALAGSSATMEDCIRWLRALGILLEEELIQVGRLNPLGVLGLCKTL